MSEDSISKKEITKPNRRSFLKLAGAAAAAAAASKLTACAPITPERNPFMSLPDIINNKESLDGKSIETEGYVKYVADEGSYNYSGVGVNFEGKTTIKTYTAYGTIYTIYPEPQEAGSYLRVFVTEGTSGKDLLPAKREKDFSQLRLSGSLRSDDLTIIWAQNEKQKETSTFLIVDRVYPPGAPTPASSPTK